MKQKLSLLVLLLLTLRISAQQKQIDSLNVLLKQAKYDTTRANLLSTMLDYYYAFNPDTIIPITQKIFSIIDANYSKANKAEKFSYLSSRAVALNSLGDVYSDRQDNDLGLSYYKQSLQLQESTIKDKHAIASILNNIAFIWNYQGKVDSALIFWERSLVLREETNDKKGVANSLTNIGFVYHNRGDISRALDYYSRALNIQEQIGEKSGMAYSLHNIAAIHQDQGDLDGALKYFARTLKLREEINDKRGIGYSLNAIAILYKIKGKPDQALNYFERSLKVRQEIEDKQGISYTLNHIGNIYFGKNDLEKALDYYEKSLKLSEEIGNKQGIATCYLYMGGVYFKQAKYPLALSFTDKALKLSKELGFPVEIRNTEIVYSKIDSAMGNYPGAYEHYKQFIKYRDSISNIETRKAGIRNQLKYEFEKKEAVIKEQQERERAVAREKQFVQTLIISSVVIVLLLVIGFAVYVFRSLKTTKAQKLVIEEKQREILDSIQYARRIQRSMLPRETYIKKSLEKLQNKN
jgi:tetratricopeptide (TPR) repeat protein